MRIQSQGQSVDTIAPPKSVELKSEQLNAEEKTKQEEDKSASKEKLQKAVYSLNEIFEINNRNLKFEYHEGLKEYFVKLVDTKTDEVIREIPSKKILDAFYEMQKLVGMIIDEKR